MKHTSSVPARVIASLLLGCLLAPALRAGAAAEALAPSQVDGGAGAPPPPPPYEQFIVIPLRVHVLTATDLPEIDCKLTDDDVRRIIGKVNSVVWQQAGIHFGIESIRREPAARQDEFRKWRDLTGGQPPPLDVYPLLRPGQDPRRAGDAPNGEARGAEDQPPGAAPAGESPPAKAAADAAAPGQAGAGESKFEGVHVYYVHELPTNGVYFGDGFSFVKETASLRPVEGGIDEPVPRVTAHELGHALGLPHRQNWTNLMQSGTTGTLLNAAEVSAARATAARLAGAAGVAAWREQASAAEEAGDVDRAARLWGWLADVPGVGAAEAARRKQAVSAD